MATKKMSERMRRNENRRTYVVHSGMFVVINDGRCQRGKDLLVAGKNEAQRSGQSPGRCANLQYDLMPRVRKKSKQRVTLAARVELWKLSGLWPASISVRNVLQHPSELRQ